MRRSLPDLTIDLTAPARAYDNLGQRTFFGAEGTVDCAVDLVGIPTDVATASNERWLGGSLRFKRRPYDPRSDDLRTCPTERLANGLGERR